MKSYIIESLLLSSNTGYYTFPSPAIQYLLKINQTYQLKCENRLDHGAIEIVGNNFQIDSKKVEVCKGIIDDPVSQYS